MGKINLSDIQVGMILATEVTNLNGQLLLPSGTEINEKHLSMLQAWGIPEVDIQGASREDLLAQAAAKIDPEILAEAEKTVSEIFRNTQYKQSPLMNELFTQCVMRMAREKSARKNDL